ncbi:MAG: transcriptional repressor [Verrucomicrobiota bacterium]
MAAEEKREEIIASIVKRLRARGMRRTKALDLILRELVQMEKPITIGDLSQKEAVSDQCDTATVYRLIDRLVAAGVVHRIGLHDRALYYQLNVPGEHHDYLICEECGMIQDLELGCPVRALEEDLRKHSGFERLRHELAFYGVCPKCA